VLLLSNLYGQLLVMGIVIFTSLIGWSVYLYFLPNGDPIVSKSYMTRVEGENKRGSKYLARLHRKTLCYSK
jgi:IS1 family transposase